MTDVLSEGLSPPYRWRQVRDTTLGTLRSVCSEYHTTKVTSMPYWPAFTQVLSSIIPNNHSCGTKIDCNGGCGSDHYSHLQCVLLVSATCKKWEQKSPHSKISWGRHWHMWNEEDTCMTLKHLFVKIIDSVLMRAGWSITCYNYDKVVNFIVNYCIDYIKRTNIINIVMIYVMKFIANSANKSFYLHNGQNVTILKSAYIIKII